MPLPARPLPSTVQEALHRGNKIEAIKRLREHDGIGLKEAKDAVEAFERDMPGMVGAHSPGEVSRAGGRIWLAVVAVLVAVVVFLLLR